MLLHPFQELERGQLIKRYKRFLADVMVGDQEVTAHCPNPGRMTSILESLKSVYLKKLPPSPARKLDYRWELAELEDTHVLVNTQLANVLAKSLLEKSEELRQRLGLSTETEVRSEQTVADPQGSSNRFDFGFFQGEENLGYLEVKQVTLRVQDQGKERVAAFPDAPSERGRRHIRQLGDMAEHGFNTHLLYLVGRDDVDLVRSAKEIDPEYAKSLEIALNQGLRVTACRVRPTPKAIHFSGFVSCLLKRA